MALVLAACGGDATLGSGTNGGMDPTAGDEGCAFDQTRLGTSCWSAAATHWAIQAEGPGGLYRFEVDLLAAGRLRSSDHPDAGPGHDEWFQDGALVRIFLSDRFVEYRTRVTNGTVLVGEAINVRGQRWSWRGDRVFGEVACSETEARLEEGCMSVAGTTWTMDGRVVQFLDGGVVALGRRDQAGEWEQTGSSLRFTLASSDGVTRHQAELQSSGELSGTVDGSGGGAWTASRIPSIPPVMHE